MKRLFAALPPARMKKYFLFLNFLSPLFLCAQDSLDAKFARSACNCFGTGKDWYTSGDFRACFEKVMQENSAGIIAACKKMYGDTSKASALKYGDELWGRLSITMISSCDIYYHSIDSLRYVDLEKLDKDSIKKVIMYVSTSNKMTGDAPYFLHRGAMYFETGNYKKALLDLDNCLKKDSTNGQAIFYKAWSLELLKRYDEAKKLYDSLAKNSGKSEFLIFSAIVERKKKEDPMLKPR
ncbi:MAG TPA: tetratricopeptide repeat protein [Bacteroidia bacterium]